MSGGSGSVYSSSGLSGDSSDDTADTESGDDTIDDETTKNQNSESGPVQTNIPEEVANQASNLDSKQWRLEIVSETEYYYRNIETGEAIHIWQGGPDEFMRWNIDRE